MFRESNESTKFIKRLRKAVKNQKPRAQPLSVFRTKKESVNMRKQIVSLIIALPMLPWLGVEQSWAGNSRMVMLDSSVFQSIVRAGKDNFNFPQPILSAPVATGRKTRECRLLGINCDI